MYNPYSSADFTKQIPSISHFHDDTSDAYAKLQEYGIRHLGISNYYPSKPEYPLSDYHTPFTGAIECPNAEHHNFGNPFGVTGRLHMNGLGSTFESGSPSGQTPVGMGGMNWADGVDLILADLIYEDAGGVTINHPKWTRMDAKACCTILDHDPRILGIEFYNQSSQEVENPPTGWSLDIWDQILKTGRRCFGLSVPDHSHDPIRGKNILLCDPTVYDCLRAYRIGAFYGKVGLTDFAFTGITYENGTLSCSVNQSATITIITDSDSYTASGTTASRSIGANDYVYARIEAKTANDEIYSNPIFLNKPGEEISDEREQFGVRFAHYFHL